MNNTTDVLKAAIIKCDLSHNCMSVDNFFAVLLYEVDTATFISFSCFAKFVILFRIDPRGPGKIGGHKFCTLRPYVCQ